MLSLRDVGRRLGIDGELRKVLRRIQKLEQDTGRRILHVRGEASGKRYTVNPEELAIALGSNVDDEPEDVSDKANAIADAVTDLLDRMESFSERLYRLEKQVMASGGRSRVG